MVIQKRYYRISLIVQNTYNQIFESKFVKLKNLLWEPKSCKHFGTEN